MWQQHGRKMAGKFPLLESKYNPTLIPLRQQIHLTQLIKELYIICIWFQLLKTFYKHATKQEWLI